MSDVFTTWSSAMRPPSRMDAVQWCERHVRLPHSDRSNRFDVSLTPWLREPMAAIFDPLVYGVVCMFPIGCSKTTMIEASACRIVSESPGYTMIVGQTDADIREWMETRMTPTFRACDSLDHLWPADRHAKRKDAIIWPHMPFVVGGATPSFLQGRSARWVFLDEAWLYPGRIKEAKKRLQRGRWNKKYVITSQGSDEGDDLHGEWQMTDQRRLWWKCPKCKGAHPWAFSQVKFDKILVSGDDGQPADDFDWGAMAPTIHIECPQCNRRHPDTPRTRRALTDSSFYEASHSHPVAGHAGFTFPSMVVWWDPLLPLVQEFLLANQLAKSGIFDPLKVFMQKQLAEFWKERTTTPTLTIPSDAYRKSAYAQGEKIDGELGRNLSVDVQKAEYWARIRAYSPEGSALLWEGRLSAWEHIRELQARFQVPNRCVFVDGRYATEDVARNCQDSKAWSDDGRPWNILMGEESDGYPFYIEDPAEIRRRGSRAARLRITRPFSTIQRRTSNAGIEYAFIKFSNRLAKDALFAAIAGSDGRHFGLPADTSREYRQHLAAEHKKEITPGKWRYVKVKPTAQNHLLDCEAMGIIGAAIFGWLANQ